MQRETLSDSGGTLVTPEKSGGFSLVGKSTRYPETETLPVGAQARLIRAAMFSEKIGYPLNTLLTINAAHLQRMSSDGVFGVGHLWDGMQNFIELARKWPEKRGVPWVAIWSREHAGGKHGQSGEHWHIGLHLPRRMHADFAEQVARWTDAHQLVAVLTTWRHISGRPNHHGYGVTAKQFPIRASHAATRTAALVRYKASGSVCPSP